MSFSTETMSESSLKKRLSKFRLNNRRMELIRVTSEKRKHLLDQFEEDILNNRSQLDMHDQILSTLTKAQSILEAFRMKPNLTELVELSGNKSLYEKIASTNFALLAQQFFADFNQLLHSQEDQILKEKIACFLLFVAGQMISFNVAASALATPEFYGLASNVAVTSSSLALLANFFFLLTVYVEQSRHRPLIQVVSIIEKDMKEYFFQKIQVKIEQALVSDQLLQQSIWEDMLQFYTCLMSKSKKALSNMIVS